MLPPPDLPPAELEPARAEVGGARMAARAVLEPRAQIVVPEAPAVPAGQVPGEPPVVEEVEPVAPLAPPVRPVLVECLASLARATPPDSGIQVGPYFWSDLLDGDAPPLPNSGEGSYAVYHAIEVDADVRITYQTLVGVRSSRSRPADEPQHRIVADARVTVQKRALLEMMDAARARADQAARKSREAQARRLARRRGAVLRWPHWATPLGFGVIRAQARFGLGIIHAKRRARRGLVEVPDVLFSSALRVQYHVGDRLARQGLVAGLKDPTTLTTEQRSVLLFLTAFFAAASVLLLNSFFALATPEFAGTYRHMLTDAALQFVGLFGAPVLVEPLLVLSTLAVGPYLAFSAFFVGKMLGAWVLYLLGHSLHHHLEKKTSGKRGRRMVDWLTRNANKYGFLILVLDNALPLAPDQLMLVFAVSGIRFRKWMLGIGVGTCVKFVALIVGVLVIGPERVEHFFAHPFG
jgi:uncharacterized membrane protein YdjX (TVP38/TMEM64 family)